MCTLCQATDPAAAYDFHGTEAGPSLTSLSAEAEAKPTYSLDQIARYLTHGYWEAQEPVRSARSFDVTAGGSLRVDLTDLSDGARAVARTALDAWTAVTDITFESVSWGGDITFGEDGEGASASSLVAGARILSSTVNVAASWVEYGSYYLQTYIHEIGHALGLGHAGNYNTSAKYGTHAHYANDSWQMTVMSYFDQGETPIDDGDHRYVDTPQMADILAIQSLYGTPVRSRAGDTVYGDGRSVFDSGTGLTGQRAHTIYDSGGTDTISLVQRAHDQRLDLRPESFSDIDGARGNLGIARGTLIENARTGSGDDWIHGNWAANALDGGGGDDTIRGGNGDDRLTGGAGSDWLIGGAGIDTAAWAGSAAGWEAVWNAEAANGGALTLRSAAGDLDRLSQIERLDFADLDLSVDELMAALSARFGPIAPGAGQSHRAALGEIVAQAAAAPPAMEIGRTTIAQSDPGAWHRVAFDGPIPDAAVVMGPPSAAGGEPLTVRVRNVTDRGFEFQIDEWDYLDGRHIAVAISWMAGTAGHHALADGSRVSFGAAPADAGRVDLAGFGAAPIVLGQLSGDRIGTALTHRIDDVSATGFSLAVQAEEARGPASGAGETLYWAGIEDRGGLLTSGRVSAGDAMTATGSLAQGRAVFADMQTVNGPDTAALRYALDKAGLLSLRVEEEGSRDAETAHTFESLGWITAAAGRHDLHDPGVATAQEAGGGTVLEIATLSVEQRSAGQWHSVDFSQAIADAAVVMGPASDAGGQPLTVRVRNVTERGFEFQIDEWDYLDGAHIPVEISWMAGSRGAHTLADGSRIVLGATDATGPAGGRVALSGFDDAPLVFAQLTGGAEARAMVHRLSDVGARGFDFALQLEEGARGPADTADELLYWIALDAGASGPFSTGTVRAGDGGAALGPGAGAGALFADMQTLRGPDPAALRYGRDGGDTFLRVEEEGSRDSETAHTWEDIAWLGARTGLFDLA